MDILKGIRKSFLTIIFSRRFIRDRYIWIFVVGSPLTILILNEFFRPNPIEQKKFDNFIKNKMEYNKYIEDIITEEDWKIYQNYEVHHFNR